MVFRSLEPGSTLAHKCVQIQGPGLKKYNIFPVNYRNDENVVFKEHI